MGNNQSNENTKKKINVYVDSKHKKGTCMIWFDFVRKEIKTSFIRFYVEDKAGNNPIFYEDGEYKYIDLANSFPYSELDSGLHLDLNYIIKYKHTKTFSVEEFWDLEGMTKPRFEEVWKDSEGNYFRDSNGSAISELTDCLGEIGEMLEKRNNMQAYMETSHRANNHAWTKQTSWDMPPGWK